MENVYITNQKIKSWFLEFAVEICCQSRTEFVCLMYTGPHGTLRKPEHLRAYGSVSFASVFY